MGDMAKKNIKRPTRTSLEEKAAEREARRNEIVNNENENTTIDNLLKKPTGKDKAISARVNSSTYTKFKKICAERGLTSNACLNMLITDFVRENKAILEE